MGYVGENMGSGQFSVDGFMHMYWDEEERWDYGRSATTGGATGHFTQIVWKVTTKLGCGLSVSGNVRNWVCNYGASGGNYNNAYARNVMARDESRREVRSDLTTA